MTSQTSQGVGREETEPSPVPPCGPPPGFTADQMAWVQQLLLNQRQGLEQIQAPPGIRVVLGTWILGWWGATVLGFSAAWGVLVYNATTVVIVRPLMEVFGG